MDLFSPVNIQFEPTPVSEKSDRYLMVYSHLQNVLVDVTRITKSPRAPLNQAAQHSYDPNLPRLSMPVTFRMGMGAKEEQHATQASFCGTPGAAHQLLSGIINREARG